MTDDVIVQIEVLIHDDMPRGMTAGLAVGIRCDDGIWTRAFSVADAERQTPLDTSTQFYIGSITKTVTAAAVMRLVETREASIFMYRSARISRILRIGGPVSRCTTF